MLKNIFKERKEFSRGIVLSGGGARGYAHLGILQALEENGWKPDIVSGTSSGALIGSFYCQGFSPEQIMKIFSGKDLSRFARITIPRKGFFTMEKLETVLHSEFHVKTFEKLDIPLVVAATNMSKGSIEYFDSGQLIPVLIASSSIPILFEPITIKNNMYSDGGILNNLPIQPIKDRCNERRYCLFQ